MFTALRLWGLLSDPTRECWIHSGQGQLDALQQAAPAQLDMEAEGLPQNPTGECRMRSGQGRDARHW